MCAAGGGCISFQNSGQMKPNKVVINPNSPQIDALKRAAQEESPFCEECEKKEKEVKPKIVRIYWMDEENNQEMKELGVLEENRDVTIFFDIEGNEEHIGKNISLDLFAPEGFFFENGADKKTFSAKIEEGDGIYLSAIIEHYEYSLKK
jgi:hypothetical protein